MALQQAIITKRTTFVKTVLMILLILASRWIVKKNNKHISIVQDESNKFEAEEIIVDKKQEVLNERKLTTHRVQTTDKITDNRAGINADIKHDESPVELNQKMEDSKTVRFVDILNITSPVELVKRLNEIQMDILQGVIGKYKQVVFFDLADIENKGDPAITVGELNILAKLNLNVLTYCSYQCSDESMRDIRNFLNDSAMSSSEQSVVLSSGGGNFGGYKYNDYKRSMLLKLFPTYNFLLFSQSTWFDFDDGSHLKFVQKAYSKHKHFTALLRDKASYEFTKATFPTLRPILAPDMAFGIGLVPRFFRATLDVIWIHRRDPESPGEMHPKFPPNISYKVMDWFSDWPSPRGQNLIDWSYMMTYNGFLFLQRGKVLVTDRLHGHILATLLDMPTVIIDNKIHKISNLRNTWTKGLAKVVMADNDQDAVNKAIHILNKIH